MQRLLVGIHLPQSLQRSVGKGKQCVLNLDLDRADDVQSVLQHQVVVVGDRACQRIFNRDDAVPPLTAADCGEHLFKGRVKLDVRLLKDLQAGFVGEGSCDTLTGSLGGQRTQLCAFGTSDDFFHRIHRQSLPLFGCKATRKSISASAAADSMQGTARRTMHGSCRPVIVSSTG